MIDRRMMLGMGALTIGGAGLFTAEAQTPPEPVGASDPFAFISPEDDPVFGPQITGRPPTAATVGTGFSRHDEVRTAFRLLYDAPRGTSQLAVARYFAAIKAVNAGHEPYNYEWKDRANPLITGLFSMTNTNPAQGDATHWCAAFVSFCLYAAGKPNMFSALSGAYRSYATPTATPVPGDVVVFAQAGPDGAKGFGHVGFFVSRTGNTVKVLGGNQRGHTGSTGAVTEADLPVSGGGLQLHSFRRVA